MSNPISSSTYSGGTLLTGTYDANGTIQLNAVGSTGGEITTNNASIILENGGNANFMPSGSFTNSGSVTVGTATTFGSNPGVTSYTQTAGSTDVKGALFASTLSQSGGSTIVEKGGLLQAGVGGYSQSAGTATINGVLQVNTNVSISSGTLYGTGTIQGPFASATSVTVGAAATLQPGGPTSTGTLNITGALTLNGTLMSALVNINGGTLSGTGTVEGAVAIGSAATLSPGNAPGTITINGTLNLSGTLDEAIDSAASFDVTDVSGQATLGSSSVLNIMLGSGFDPAVGASFTIMDFASLASGSAFGSILNQTFNGGTEDWAVSYNSTNIVLTAQAVSTSSTPEPASLLLLGTGLVVLGLAMRKRNRAQA